MKNGHQLYVDGSFEMEFVVAGEDEHGLPLLEVIMYPVIVGMSGDNLVFGVDGRHLLAGLTIPLEDTGLSTTDLDSLPLHDGWATISTAHGEGLRPQDLEGTFGPRSAVIVLEALADALLSESINADTNGRSYRSVELNDNNRYEEVLAMHKNLQSRIDVEDPERVTHDVFNAMMSLRIPRLTRSANEPWTAIQAPNASDAGYDGATREPGLYCATVNDGFGWSRSIGHLPLRTI